jgi:hypothetical protein
MPFLRVALRHSAVVLFPLAAVTIASLAGITAREVYFADRGEKANRYRLRLERAYHDLEARRPLREPIGEPIPGAAADDYTWRCVHRHPSARTLPRTASDLPGLGLALRARLEDPLEIAVVDRFARGIRREDAGILSLPRGCLRLAARPDAVIAAALLDAERGDVDRAWTRAVSVVRYSDDLLGRAPVTHAVPATASATVAVAVMADLARAASGDRARRWRNDVARLRASAIDPDDVSIALAIGERLDVRSSLAAHFRAMTVLATGGDSDIRARCEQVGAHSGFCSVLAAGVSDVTVVAAGLESLDCALAPPGDLRCESLARRL